MHPFRLVAMAPQLVSAESRAERERATMLQIINYLAALAEKVANDTSFNELDYTFLRLEQMAGELDSQGRDLPDDERQPLAYRTLKPSEVPRQSRGTPWFI